MLHQRLFIILFFVSILETCTRHLLLCWRTVLLFFWFVFFRSDYVYFRMVLVVPSRLGRLLLYLFGAVAMWRFNTMRACIKFVFFGKVVDLVGRLRERCKLHVRLATAAHENKSKSVEANFLACYNARHFVASNIKGSRALKS